MTFTWIHRQGPHHGGSGALRAHQGGRGALRSHQGAPTLPTSHQGGQGGTQVPYRPATHLPLEACPALLPLPGSVAVIHPLDPLTSTWR